MTAVGQETRVAGTGSGCSGNTSKSFIDIELAGVAQLARASAFQAEGRGFESRFPLQINCLCPHSSGGRALPW
jgi:hypothetical protein